MKNKSQLDEDKEKKVDAFSSITGVSTKAEDNFQREKSDTLKEELLRELRVRKKIQSKTNKVKLTIIKNKKAVLRINNEKIEVNIKSGSDYFKVLMLLIKNKERIVSYDEIENVMKPKESINTSAERRARDTISYIRNKFGYKKDDFIRTDYGFQLVCDVEVKE